ncbi:hypothetical protein Adt_18360 [Abeliophyllum distichum]|uniref:Uncharacterized protein n=1 Tax=Abeliophyllum distichum TaxID=126358 RepID=A0ABD1TJ54_9LAMI
MSKDRSGKLQFFFTFPDAKRSRWYQSEKSQLQKRERARSVKLLIVVDEPKNQQVMVAFLGFSLQQPKKATFDKWRGKNYHQERMVQRANFHGHLLEHVIQQCGWSKVATAPHPAYITLVREFFANFNKEIDTPESSYRHKTWVRGKWIRFSPVMIYRYYELNRMEIDPMPTEMDMQSWIFLEAGVPLLRFEEADTPEVPLTHKAVDNSEARMRAREIRARRAPTVQPDEATHDPAPLVPQPALAADNNLGIQFTQIQVALTKIGRSMNDMQNTLVGIQHTQNNMQQELLRVSMLIRGW